MPPAYLHSAIEFSTTREPEKFRSFTPSTKMGTCTTGHSKVVSPRKESRLCMSLVAIRWLSEDHPREKIRLQRLQGLGLISSIKTIKNMLNTIRQLVILSTPILLALKLTRPRAASSVWVLAASPSLRGDASTPMRILKSSLNTSMGSQILEINKAHWESLAEVAKATLQAKASNKLAPPSINIKISRLQRAEPEARAPTPTRIKPMLAITSNCSSTRIVLLLCIPAMPITAMSSIWKTSRIRCWCGPARCMARAPCTRSIWQWCKRRPTAMRITCSSTSTTWPKWQKLPSRRLTTGSIRASLAAWSTDLTASSPHQCLSSRTFHLHHPSAAQQANIHT